MHGHDDPPPYPYAYYSSKQASAATSSVSLAGSVTFAVVTSHAHHDRVPPVPPLPAVHPSPAVHPTTLDPALAPFPVGPAGSPGPAGMVGPMAAAGEKRPAWKRGTSMRGSSRRVPKHTTTAYPQRIMPTGRPDESDGYVPYRPPFASRSTGSLSPVAPSGAQGIGLVPAPAPPPPPLPEKARRSIFNAWPFSGRRRKRSEPAPTLHPGASTASFGTTYAGYSTHAHHSHSHSHSRVYPHQHDLHSDPANKYGPRFSAYAPKGKQFVAPSSSHNPGVTQSPSVLTGLVAPRMLFSPLSRHLGTEGLDASGVKRFSSTSTPNLSSPTHADPNQTEHLTFAPDTRPYPRVGNNQHQGPHSQSWASLPGSRSSVTLHSEGSRSRLAVTTVCDALTFPRPRMNAHDITPPETPQQNAAGGANGYGHDHGNETDATDYDDDEDIMFSEAVARSKAREAEREEWERIVNRRGRSSSLGRDSVSTPSTPSGLRHRLHSVASGNRRGGGHGRSRSGSGSLHSFLGRTSRNRDRDRAPGIEDASQPVSASDHSSYDSLHTPVARSQSYRTNRRGIGIFESLRYPPPQGSPIQKSTSSPQLSSDDHDGPRSPKRSQSLKHQGSKSNPDLGIGSSKAFQTAIGSASPRKPHRQTGPPRSFQFRLQSQQPRAAPVNGTAPSVPAPAQAAGVVVVGPSSTVTLARTPKSIDFADPYRSDRPPSPSPPPQVPTPNGGLPFSFNSDEIGVAITTAGNEAAEPPPTRERTQDSSQVSVLQPSPLPKEPPSSAHARYLLARQHRRSMTLRAFQSPAFSPARKQPVPAVPPITFVPLAPSSDGPKTPPPLPFSVKTHALSRGPISPASPRSPRSPVSPEGKARGTSTLGPRTGPAGRRVRPRSAASSSGHSNAGSESPKITPRPASPIEAPIPIPIPPSPPNRPLRTDKDLPPVPTSPPPSAARPSSVQSSSVPPSPRLPPPGAPPSRPVPPTPTSRPNSRPSSFDGAALRFAGSITTVAALEQGAAVLARTSTPPTARAAAPSTQGTTAPSPSNVNPAPLISRPITPQAQTLPTIMDESPTPVRQTTVTVLSPPPASPTPISGTARGYPFTSTRTNRPRAPASKDVFSNRKSMPVVPMVDSTFSEPRAHRTMPSVSAVIPSPELFRGPQEFYPPASGSNQRPQSEHSRVSPDFFRESINRELAVLDRSDVILLPRSTSNLTSVASGEASFALADDSGVLGREPEEAPQRIPPLPRPGVATSDDMEHLGRSSGSQSRSHESHDTRESRDESTDADAPSLENVPIPLRRAVSADSHGSFYTTEAATTLDEWPRYVPATDLGDEDSDSHSEATLPDMFPQSSSSQLSHYTDAEEGDAWSSPADTAETPHIPQAPQPIMTEREEELADIERAESVSTPPSSSDDPTPKGSVISVSTSSKRLSPLSEQMENLAMTPRPGPSQIQPAEDEYESADSRTRRASFSSGSVSSGSEISVRHSFDENFRGLFYRTPHVPSPEQSRSLRQRLRPSPRRRAGHIDDHLTESPEIAAPSSEASGELRTPVVDFPMPPGSEHNITGSLAPSLPVIPQGLGIMTGGTGFLGLETDVGITPSPARTPPTSSGPRDDSWITESYHRLSQVVARGATPSRQLSLRKPRPYSADQAVPFSPTTFGVHTDRFADSPGPSTPRSQRRTTSSGSSTADPTPLTPNPDVVEKFPSPPHRI